MTQRIKRLVTVLGVMVLIPLSASASASPCASASLETYIALGSEGCILGGLRVFAFSYTAEARGGASEITAQEISVNPLLAPVGDFALQFSAPWRVQSGQTQKSLITYKARSLTAGRLIQQIRLEGNGVAAGLVDTVAVNEAATEKQAGYHLRIFMQCEEVCRARTSATRNIPPTRMLLVSGQVALDSKSGTAALSDFVSWFSECPLCVAP